MEVLCGVTVMVCVVFQDAEGQYFLGICYENGWGVESSDEEAARLYAAAADAGHDGAIYNLAAFHEYGLGGRHIFFFFCCLTLTFIISVL